MAACYQLRGKQGLDWSGPLAQKLAAKRGQHLEGYYEGKGAQVEQPYAVAAISISYSGAASRFIFGPNRVQRTIAAMAMKPSLGPIFLPSE